jgi:hypothetical protein
VELTDGEVSWKAVKGQQPQKSQLNKAEQEFHTQAIMEAKSKLLMEQGIDAADCTLFFKALYRPLLYPFSD